MVHQAIQQPLIILLSRIEIGVTKGTTITITPGVYKQRVYTAPSLKTALLLFKAGIGLGIFGDNGRLKVIRQSDDQMQRSSANRSAREPLPGVGRQPARRAADLSPTHHRNKGDLESSLRRNPAGMKPKSAPGRLRKTILKAVIRIEPRNLVLPRNDRPRESFRTCQTPRQATGLMRCPDAAKIVASSHKTTLVPIPKPANQHATIKSTAFIVRKTHCDAWCTQA